MVGSGCRSYLSLQSRSPTGFKSIYLDLMFGPDAGRAGERSFRDFFRLPPTKENRSQSVDPACRLCGELHWQVAGPTFYQLHLLYDKHYGEQVEAVDSIAERIQLLGGVSLAMGAEVAETTRIERPLVVGKKSQFNYLDC